jgi:hypothetical protein
MRQFVTFVTASQTAKHEPFQPLVGRKALKSSRLLSVCPQGSSSGGLAYDKNVTAGEQNSHLAMIAGASAFDLASSDARD